MLAAVFFLGFTVARLGAAVGLVSGFLSLIIFLVVTIGSFGVTMMG